MMVLVPPTFLSILSQAVNHFSSRPPLDSISINGELSTWDTPQILHFIRTSTDQLEQRITIAEHCNQSLTQQEKYLREVINEATTTKSYEQNLWV
jgi:hypothetical protein